MCCRNKHLPGDLDVFFFVCFSFILNAQSVEQYCNTRLFLFNCLIQIYAVCPEGRSRPMEILHSVNTTCELKYLIFVNSSIIVSYDKGDKLLLILISCS